MLCDTCLEVRIPDCLDTLTFSGYFSGNYLLVFTNHFGSKVIVESDSNYADDLVVSVDSFPDGYFFPGNTYTVKIYESLSDFECDNAVSFCYNECISIEVYKATGQEENFNIFCCG